MAEGEPLEIYRKAAEHSTAQSVKIIKKYVDSPLSGAVEAALNIKLNYAAGIRDVIDFLQTGTASDRLSALVETYKAELAKEEKI